MVERGTGGEDCVMRGTGGEDVSWKPPLFMTEA
jgi:hypothetical protein